MKPIDIRPSTQFNTVLLQNIELTKGDVEIECSIENVEVAFLRLKYLYELQQACPKTKYIKRDIQRVTKYIKAECKLISKTLKLKRKSKKGN
jgi:hypothetical protein